MYEIDELESLSAEVSPKEARKLQIPIILRLLTKLEEKEIEDEQITKMIGELFKYLNVIVKGDDIPKRAYKKAVRFFIEYVRKTYDFVAKGTYTGMWIAIGVALGPGFGAAFTSINPSFIGAGAGIGIAIGVAIGSFYESKAEKEGKLY